MHPGLRVSTQNLKETVVPLSDYLAMAQHYLLDFQNDGTVGHHLDLETVLVNFIWVESDKFCCFLDMVCVVLNPQATVFLTTTPLIFRDSGLHLYKSSLAPLCSTNIRGSSTRNLLKGHKSHLLVPSGPIQGVAGSRGSPVKVRVSDGHNFQPSHPVFF